MTRVPTNTAVLKLCQNWRLHQWSLCFLKIAYGKTYRFSFPCMPSPRDGYFRSEASMNHLLTTLNWFVNFKVLSLYWLYIKCYLFNVSIWFVGRFRFLLTFSNSTIWIILNLRSDCIVPLLQPRFTVCAVWIMFATYEQHCQKYMHYKQYSTCLL